MKPAFAVIFVLLLSSCAPSEVHNLDPLEVQELLSQKEQLNLFVVNVHTPYEGELEKTDVIIEDWEHIAAHVDQLPKDKSRPILVYCRSGRMSTSAIDQLKELGYENLYHLDGGMKAWADANLSVLNKSSE